jgi:hypothetical protein
VIAWRLRILPLKGVAIMSTHITGLRRLGLVLALAPLAIAAFAAPAQADDRGRHNDRGRHYDRGHDRRWYGRPGGYYAPPPPVYYPQQPVSPGISLFFPIR